MINILIVEDDSAKRDSIASTISTALHGTLSSIEAATNIIDAKNLLSSKYYDVLILDLVLPLREGDHPLATAGSDLLYELPLIAAFKKPGTVIGMTAYSEVFKSDFDKFQDNLWYLLAYDSVTSEWKKHLANRIVYLVESLKHGPIGTDTGYHYDVAIITAMHSPELTAILTILEGVEEFTTSMDETIYYLGTLSGSNGSLKVVAACARQMGMTAACAVSMKCISQFRPRYIVLAGISAGLKSSGVGIGDVLICDESWNYDSGKRVVENGTSLLHPDPKHIGLDAGLFARLQQLVGNKSFVKDISGQWKGSALPSTELRAHLGPVTSGSAVVKDVAVSKFISSHARTVIGLEMETYGVYYAAANCCNPKPRALSVKSVCDFADEHKSDDFQPYAAFTSAQYVKKLASSGIFD